ncbi:MAG TPA: efflux RND transporter periplasmic adaptor subunit [Myxococcales bacterium]|nr:efflux RND transporter periplasmic adaptor subunit [Myxococcales bacterium]
MRPALRNVLLVVAGIAGGVTATAVLLVPRRHAPPPVAAQAPARQWHCPMHPTYVSDKPGDCPVCGMRLVPLEPGEQGALPDAGAPRADGYATVQIDPQRQQLIGLRTAPVVRAEIGAAWRTVGRVAVDETRVRRINVKVDGFVEKLHVDFVGKPVRQGQALFALYSPELVSAQNEYLLAVKTRAQLGPANQRTGDELVQAARRRLELWDVPRSEIAHLDHGGDPLRTLTFYSPISGVVTAKSVVQGSKIAAGDTPFEVTDLSQVWVLADAYESDISRVKVGTPAVLRIDALPNRVFKGRVGFVDPLLDPKTRTAKIRVSFANPDLDLKPDMFGDVSFAGRTRLGLRIPLDALIDSGAQKVVFVSLGQGRFQPREITTGAQTAEHVEVLSGLAEGDQVVTGANFLIDSESRLKSALAALAQKAPTPARTAADPHAGHGK